MFHHTALISEASAQQTINIVKSKATEWEKYLQTLPLTKDEYPEHIRDSATTTMKPTNSVKK